MELSLIVVIVLRLLFPLLIFRWNLSGALLAIFLDAIDYPILALSQSQYLESYQDIDKIFDYYYLSLEAVTVLWWPNTSIRKILLGLFTYRAIGVIAFEMLNIRALLFFFPNVFEYLYLYYLAIRHSSKEVRLNRTFIVVAVAILLMKLVHEYILHFGQFEYWKWILG
jgi:hypothetical protein